MVALALLSGRSGWADCRPDGLRLFPAPGSTVPTNTQLILEGVGKDQPKVAALVGTQLVLEGPDDLVPVKVSRGWISTRHRIAVVLKPVRRLKADSVYQLLLDSAVPEYTMLEGPTEPPRWKTGANADTTGPRATIKPAIFEGLYRSEGDQLTRLLKVRTELVDESPIYLVVTLKRVRGPAGVQSYFVPLNGGVGTFGHDGCSGSFTFDDGRAYRGTFLAVDASGNQGAVSPALEFQAPRQEPTP